MPPVENPITEPGGNQGNSDHPDLPPNVKNVKTIDTHDEKDPKQEPEITHTGGPEWKEGDRARHGPTASTLPST